MNNFVPGAVNTWGLLNFCDGIGALYPHPQLTRRPATCTIRANINGVAANELIPITIYHTPLNAPAMAGMGQAAFSRSLYQAYDHTVPGYIDCNRAVFGGDFNKPLNQNANNFTIYTADFAIGGAGCNTPAVAPATPNIRVNTPFPPGGLPLPIYPPLPAAPSARDNPLNKSLIILNTSFIGGNKRLSVRPYDYRTSPFDNIFYRGFTALQAPHHAFGDLYDLLSAVTGIAPAPVNFLIFAGTIQAFQTAQIFNPPGGGGPVAPAIMPYVSNPATLLQDIQAGGFGNAWIPPAAPVATGVANPAAGAGPYAGPLPIPMAIPPQRRAAEFVKLFISDHLPVIFEMNL
jgi:hypothetical protein